MADSMDEAIAKVRSNPTYKDWSDEAIRGALMRAQAEQNNADAPMHPQMKTIYEQISNQIAKVRDFATAGMSSALGGKMTDVEQWMKIPGMTREKAEQLAGAAKSRADLGAKTVVPQTPVDAALMVAAPMVGRGVQVAGRPLVSAAARTGLMTGIGAAAGAATDEESALGGAVSGGAQGAAAGLLGEVFNYFLHPKLEPAKLASAMTRAAPGLQPLRQKYTDPERFFDRVVLDGPDVAHKVMSGLDERIVKFYGGPDKVIHSRVAAKLEQAAAQGPTAFIPPGQGGYNVSQAGTSLSQVAAQNPQNAGIVNDALVDYSVRKISGDNTYKMISVSDALTQIKTLKTDPSRESRALGEALENELLSQTPASLRDAYKQGLKEFRKIMNVVRIVSEWRSDLGATHETWGKAIHKLTLGRPDSRGNPDPVFHLDEIGPIMEALGLREGVGRAPSSGLHLYGRAIGGGFPHIGAPMSVGASPGTPFRQATGRERNIRALSEIAGVSGARAARESLGDFVGD